MVTRNTHRQRPARDGRTRRRHAAGFTLVEILMVVLILGIASAIVAPSIGSRSDVKLRAASRLVIADLMYAQNMAISQQRWTYVRFDAAGEKYDIMEGSGTSTSDNSRILSHPVTKTPFTTRFGVAADSRMGDVKIKSASFNGVDTNYRPEFTLVFDELGVPYVYCYDDAATNEMFDGTIELECGKETIKVIVERYTGDIKVQ